jgi:dienelactone hydrolase
LAELGYVALACDLFGERVIPADDARRREAFEEFRSKKLLPRARAGLEALAAQPQVDPSRLGAIGFCLGGMTALELARSGAELKGVVSFHGSLGATRPAAADQVKARVLVCHGALDPFITTEQLTSFTKEMQAAAVDWQVNVYGGAKHGFTNPLARSFGHPGVDYHEPTDLRSWAAMRQFFDELFGAGART